MTSLELAELVAKLGIDRPVAFALGAAERLLEPRAEVGGEAVIVEQGVVDIEQKDDQAGI